MALWGLSGPATLAIMTRLVSPSEQGQLAGANTALASIAGLVAPGTFALAFSYYLGELPGAPFLLAGAVLVLAALVSWAVTGSPVARGPTASRPSGAPPP